MKKLYFTLLALIISSMAFAQVLVNEGFETNNTVGETPVGWICSDNGWRAGITIPDPNTARGRKPHTGDWYMYATYNTDVWTYKEISVTAGNYYRVSFWYVTWETDHFNLEVKAGASANPSAMSVNVVPLFIVDNVEYQQASAVFQATSTGNYYVGFHAYANNFAWYLSIDDVIIEHTDQYNFEIEQITADTSVYFGESAYLRFRLNNLGEQADTYQLTNTSSLPVEFYQNGSQVSQVSLAYNTSVDLVAKTTLPMNLNNNQTVNVTFDVTSSHAAPTQSANFAITALAPINTYPLMEGFEDETFPPAGWQNIATNGSYVFERRTSNDWPACNPHNESAGLARYNSYYATEGYTCSLVSPKLQLNANDNQVRFWIFRNYNSWLKYDKINVYYSPTTDPTDGTLLGSVHRNTALDPYVGESTDFNDWYEYVFSFDCPEGYGFVILEAESGRGWDLCIDDIFINSTSVDNNPPMVVSLDGTQTWADTPMDITLRVYDESGVPNQMQATYTIDGQSHDITLTKTSKGNYDYTATLPAQPNHTTATIIFHMADELGNAADSDPFDLHWDWQAPILLEGFEGEQFPPAGWEIQSLNMSWFSWYRFGPEYASNYFGDEYYVVPPQGVRMAGVEWDESEEWGPQDESLVTPLLAINRPTTLTFETFCQYGIPDYLDHYKVDVLNTNTGTWTTLWDAVDQPQWVNQFQEPVQIDLSSYEGENIRLRFRAHNNGSDILTYSWFIDNVKVVPTDTLTPQGVGGIDLKASIYPNPVEKLMTIQSDEEIQLISVYNILGIKVKEVAVANREAVVDLSKLEAGVYMIEIVGVNNKSVKTFIKQ